MCVVGVCVTVLHSLPASVSWWLLIWFQDYFFNHNRNPINLLCSRPSQEYEIQLKLPSHIQAFKCSPYKVAFLISFNLKVSKLRADLNDLSSCYQTFVRRGYCAADRSLAACRLLIVHGVTREFISRCVQTADSPNIR